MMGNKKINQMLQDFIDREEIANGAYVIRKKGEVVAKDVLGYADILHKVPLKEDTIFRLASMTKPVMAVAAMILVERGLLKLSDPVKKYLPEFADMTVVTPYIDAMEAAMAENDPVLKEKIDQQVKQAKIVPTSEDILVVDLLNHSSGLGQGPVGLKRYDEVIAPEDTLAERVGKISAMPCDFIPGTKCGYSGGVAFEIIGRIIELLSGKNLDEFVKTEIFDKLGAKDIGYALDESQKRRIVILYRNTDGKLLDDTDTDAPWKNANPLTRGYFSGSAGMFGTLDAYDRFGQMLYNDGAFGDEQVLSKTAVEEMAVDLSKHKNGLLPGTYWGLAMLVFHAPEMIKRPLGKGTFGWSGAYGTHFYVDRANELQVTFMTNRSDIGGASSIVSMALEKVVFEEYCI